jgi:hypothetical protein
MSIVRSPVRSVVRSPVQGVFGGSASLLEQATSALGNVAPYHWLDFIANRALYASVDVGNVTQATGYSFTRASDGYYTNSDGTLTNFASGALRRGDRGVLIEGARTNLIFRSQEFGTTWTVQRTTVTENTIAAPDGTTTADTMLETVDNGNHGVFQNITKAASSITYALSCHIKPNGRDWAILQLTGPGETNRVRVWFDLTGSGTVGSNVAAGTGFSFVSASIQALANGWYRCVAVITGDTDTSHTLHIRPATGDTLIAYAGDITKGLYLWGAQLEAASFASSYIPTVAASATRAADSLLYTAGVSYPLSLWAEFERSADTGGTELVMVVDDGDLSDYASMTVDGTDLLNSVMVRASVSQGGSAVTGATAALTVYKGAVRFNTNSIMAARGGTLGLEDTVATLAATPTTIRLGAYAGGINYSFQYLRKIAIFNSALTDAQLQTVST